MKMTWEVDESTTVDADIGGLGKEIIKVNGVEVVNRRNWRTKSDIPFQLPDGRSAVISVKVQFASQAVTELRIAGALVTPTGKEPIICGKCNAKARPYDRFCQNCGNELPPPEYYVHLRHVKGATGAIYALSGMFLVFGGILFAITKSQADALLQKLAGMDPASTLPEPINGVTYTVESLRAQVSWEPWSVLIVNMVLATIMLGLAIWGKRAPLAAILVAAATYAVVIVVNAIVDPATIAQGLILKIFVIAILAKGIKSALALRPEKT